MLKNIVFIVGYFFISSVLFADIIVTLNNDAKAWKLFQWVKDGKVEYQNDILKVATNAPGKGLHYFYDTNIDIGNGIEATVSFDWKAEVTGDVKLIFLTAGFYQYNAQNRYMNKAFPCGSVRTAGKSADWKTFKRTVKITPEKVAGAAYLKTFLSFSKGGNFEIKNLKIEIKNIQ